MTLFVWASSVSYIFHNSVDMFDPPTQLVPFCRLLVLRFIDYVMAAEAVAEWNGVMERTICAPLEKVWSVASDFLRFPNLLTIEAVVGENGVAGCTRKVSNLPGRTDTHSHQWAKQKLVEINPQEHLFSYEFLENNTGVDPGYYSTFQAQQEESGKTLVRWAFQFSPSQAGFDRFVLFILSGTNLYVEELEKLAAT